MLAACSVDTVVYELQSAASEARPPSAGASAGGAGANAQSPLIYGCNVDAPAGGAPAIVQIIVSSASEVSEWVRTDRNCAEDRDCHAALLTPACNRETTFCQPCPVGERALYYTGLADCLTRAITDCCANPDAERDCVFRRCQRGCGPQ